MKFAEQRAFISAIHYIDNMGGKIQKKNLFVYGGGVGWLEDHNMLRFFQISLKCTGKLNLLKAQLCASNTSDSTTIPFTVQNWQITS